MPKLLTRDALACTELQSLVWAKRSLVTALPYMSMKEILERMELHRVSSLPVCAEEVPEDYHKGPFQGVLTLFDVLSFVAFHCFKYDEPVPSQFEQFNRLSVKVEEVVQARFHAEDNRVWIVKGKDSLTSVFEPFCKGVHRVLVEFSPGDPLGLVPDSDKKKTSYRMLTQSDVINFLLVFTGHRTSDGMIPVVFLTTDQMVSYSVFDQVRSWTCLRALSCWVWYQTSAMLSLQLPRCWQ